MSGLGPGEIGGRLLEVQGMDSKAAALRREMETLAEKHRLRELQDELKRTGEEQAAAEMELEDTEHRQHKLDGELEILSAKIAAEEEKLFSGTVMNPKELSAIQAEILSLRKKRDEMETEDLEMMEEIDRLRVEVRRHSEASDEVAARERRAREEHDRELAEKEHQLEELEVERDRLKEGLDPEILDTYHKLLEEKGGLAVVRIEMGKNCGGCHIEFSRSQIDRFQHEEGVFSCEYCRRILVK